MTSVSSELGLHAAYAWFHEALKQPSPKHFDIMLSILRWFYYLTLKCVIFLNFSQRLEGPITIIRHSSLVYNFVMNGYWQKTFQTSRVNHYIRGLMLIYSATNSIIYVYSVYCICTISLVIWCSIKKGWKYSIKRLRPCGPRSNTISETYNALYSDMTSNTILWNFMR